MGELAEIVRRSDFSPRTKEEYRRCIMRWEAFAGSDPASWTPIRVEKWRDSLRDSGLSRGSVNKHLYALRYAARRASVLGYCHDFASAAESLRAGHAHHERKTRRRALSVEEVAAILEACDYDRGPRGRRDAAIVTTALKTGLRASALCAAKWDSISGSLIGVPEKGRRSARAVLDEETALAIGMWREALEAATGEAVSGRLFRSVGQLGLDGTYRIGRGMSRQSLWRAVSDRATAAGIRRPIYPHLFRHTFISWALSAGVPPERVMAATGQASMTTLARYYTDLQAETDPIAGYLPKLRR